ncbi:uncharacterized protein LOC143857678 [Tasmannia lanceolata]|uniref:uncharacterized protein LOC143857678 n=1 Tax=Tasmannia lanceolata TaxID=3420 RepID=UPI004062ED9B
MVAALNMEGDALDWYQWYIDYKPEATWDDMVEAMDARFGPTRSENYAGRLSKLCQDSTVLDYQKEFQVLSNKVKGLSESYLIEVFISGLKDELRVGVQKMKPVTLPEVFNLARLLEEAEAIRLQLMRPSMLLSGPTTTTKDPSIPPIKRINTS